MFGALLISTHNIDFYGDTRKQYFLTARNALSGAMWGLGLYLTHLCVVSFHLNQHLGCEGRGIFYVETWPNHRPIHIPVIQI